MKYTMYVMTHKEVNEKKIPEDRTMLLVGAEGKEFDQYLRDDQGENISLKNKSFCELTGLYWVFKHSDSDIIGLEHYRRLFSKRKWNFFGYKAIPLAKLNSYLENYDLVLPEKHCWPKYPNLYQEYKNEHIQNDMDMLENIIKEDYKDYLDSWNLVIHNNNWCYNYNMFYGKKEILNDYFEFLFDVLFKLESRINLEDGRDDYQKRVFGFLSERLFNVWIAKKGNLKIKEVPIISLQDKPLYDVKRRLYRTFKWKKQKKNKNLY